MTTRLTLLLLVIGNLSITAADSISVQCCDKLFVKEQWSKVGALYYSEPQSAIQQLNKILECATNLDVAPNIISDILIAANYSTERQLYISARQEAKETLDWTSDFLYHHDSLKQSKARHYKYHNYLYGEYFRQSGLFEMAAIKYNLVVDSIFSDLKWVPGATITKEEVSEIIPFPPLDLFNNAAIVQRKIGDYTKANLYYRIALLLSDPLNKWQIASVQSNLGYSYTKLGNHEKAIVCYETAMEILKQKNDAESKKALTDIYKNIAETYFRQTRIDKAHEYIEKAKQLSQLPLSKILINQLSTEILLYENRLDEASQLIVEGKKLTLEALGSHHPEMSDNFLLESQLASISDNNQEADSLMNNALGILIGENKCNCHNLNVNDLLDKNRALEVLVQKAAVLLDLENEEWKVCYEKLKALIELLNEKHTFSEDSRLNLVKTAKAYYSDAVEVLWQRGHYSEAYSFAKAAKGMVLLQNISDQSATHAGLIPEKIINQGKTILIKLNQVKKTRDIALLNGNKDETNETEKILLGLEHAYEQWKINTERDYPYYSELKYKNKSKTLKELTSALDKDEVIIDYFLTTEKLYTFIIASSGLKSHSQSINSSFTTDIERFEQAVSSNKDDDQTFTSISEIGYRLYGKLIEPLEKYNLLQQKLIIIPDEAIHLVAFDALLTEPYSSESSENFFHTLPYLIKRYNISYNYTSDLIQEKKSGHGRNRVKLLAIAPEFQNKNLKPLTHNNAEVESVLEFVSGTILSGAKATYDAFIDKYENYNVVHLATHASFNQEVPLDSRIELADKPLYIYDLSSLNHNFELAVLSACETAGGRQLAGEGILSLTRAVIQSGCPGVVSNNWLLSDTKSKTLMTEFYTYLSQKHDSKIALHKAKLNFLENTTTRNTHPFYWAGLIHTGTAFQVQNNNVLSINILVTALLFFTTLGFILRRNTSLL